MLAKVCTVCGIEKPLNEFNKAKGNKYGYYSICRECCSIRNNPTWLKEHRERDELFNKGFKKCTKCNKIKSITEFQSRKDAPYGLKYECNLCYRTRAREYARTPKQKAKKKEKESKPEFLQQLSEYRKNSDVYKNNLIKYRQGDKFKEYQEEYRKRDYVKIRRDLSTRIWMELNLYKKTKKSSSNEYLGCTVEYFMGYIQEQFTEGMTWENHGRGSDKWHIDHIMPCASFDMNNDEEVHKCFHYTNQQPLWEVENLRKNSKYNGVLYRKKKIPIFAGQKQDNN